MSDVVDVYSDQFKVATNAYGVSLVFSKTPAGLTGDPSKGTPPIEDQVYVRMSLQHIKIMTIVLARHLKQMERLSGVKTELPSSVLNGLGISQEDWDEFWKTS